MLEAEIQHLVARDSKFGLERLESDIWAREARIREAKGAARLLVRAQAVVMAFAIAGSAAAASSAAMRSPATPAGILGVDSLAPSSLLFGAHR